MASISKDKVIPKDSSSGKRKLRDDTTSTAARKSRDRNGLRFYEDVASDVGGESDDSDFYDGHPSEMVEITRNAMEFANVQLKVIADWPKKQREAEAECRAEVMKQLQDIPELSLRDRVQLMYIMFFAVCKRWRHF